MRRPCRSAQSDRNADHADAGNARSDMQQADALHMPNFDGTMDNDLNANPAKGERAGKGQGGFRQPMIQLRADSHAAAHRGRTLHGQDDARRLQRAAARRNDGGFLVQPLQRVRRQGRRPLADHLVRTRRDSPARHGQIPRSAGSHGEESGDAVLTSTTGCPPIPSPGRSCSRNSSSGGNARAAHWRRPFGMPRFPQGGPRRMRIRTIRTRKQEAGARPERKLRPRTDGTAHARRGWRLHAGGRDQCRQAFTGWTHPAAAARSGIFLRRSHA